MATPPCGWTSPPEPLLALQWNSHFCSLPEAYEQYPSTNPFLTTRDTTEEGSIVVVFSNFPLDQAHCQSNNKACESRPPKPVQFLEASPPARHGEGLYNRPNEAHLPVAVIVTDRSTIAVDSQVLWAFPIYIQGHCLYFGLVPHYPPCWPGMSLLHLQIFPSQRG